MNTVYEVTITVSDSQNRNERGRLDFTRVIVCDFSPAPTELRDMIGESQEMFKGMYSRGANPGSALPTDVKVEAILPPESFIDDDNETVVIDSDGETAKHYDKARTLLSRALILLNMNEPNSSITQEVADFLGVAV
jgi:hypothetical protein